MKVKLAKLSMSSMEFLDELANAVGHANGLPVAQIAGMITHLGRVGKQIDGALAVLESIHRQKQSATNQTNQSKPTNKP